MNDTVNEPSDQNDAPQDTQPPAPRRGSLSAKWSLIFGILAWILAATISVVFVCIVCIAPDAHFSPGIERSIRLTIFCILYSIPLCSLLGVVLGHASNSARGPRRDRKAITGLVLGYLMLVFFIFVVFILPALARARSETYCPSCQNNLKKVGLYLKMYRDENRQGFFPELLSEPGILAISNISGYPFYPEYITDPFLLFCVEKEEREKCEAWRADPNPQVLFNHSSYIYLGYAMESEAEVEAFAEAYRQRVAQGLPFDEDLSVPPGKGNNGSDTIYRLRGGVEKYFITDINNPAASATAQSKIPVLIERLGNHEHEGGNVLYLDGHVKFIRYPGDWPMTEKTIAILKSIEAMRK